MQGSQRLPLQLMPYESWSESVTGVIAAAVVALIVALVLWLT
jgi:hypothetical protein